MQQGKRARAAFDRAIKSKRLRGKVETLAAFLPDQSNSSAYFVGSNGVGLT